MAKPNDPIIWYSINKNLSSNFKSTSNLSDNGINYKNLNKKDSSISHKSSKPIGNLKFGRFHPNRNLYAKSKQILNALLTNDLWYSDNLLTNDDRWSTRVNIERNSSILTDTHLIMDDNVCVY